MISIHKTIPEASIRKFSSNFFKSSYEFQEPEKKLIPAGKLVWNVFCTRKIIKNSSKRYLSVK